MALSVLACVSRDSVSKFKASERTNYNSLYGVTSKSGSKFNILMIPVNIYGGTALGTKTIDFYYDYHITIFYIH